MARKEKRERLEVEKRLRESAFSNQRVAEDDLTSEAKKINQRINRKITAQRNKKKTPAKKSPAKKSPSKKSPSKKTAPKKTAAKKTAPKKTAAKKTAAKEESDDETVEDAKIVEILSHRKLKPKGHPMAWYLSVLWDDGEPQEAAMKTVFIDFPDLLLAYCLKHRALMDFYNHLVKLRDKNKVAIVEPDPVDGNGDDNVDEPDDVGENNNNEEEVDGKADNEDEPEVVVDGKADNEDEPEVVVDGKADNEDEPEVDGKNNNEHEPEDVDEPEPVGDLGCSHDNFALGVSYKEESNAA